MHAEIQKYIPVLEFFAAIFGQDTEVVLQDFTNGLDHSVVYIKNNLSGREVGAPATDFVLEVLHSKIYLEKQYIVNYRTKTVSGKELYSSSFFIIDQQNELIGMICINSDKSRLIAMSNILEAALNHLRAALATDIGEKGTKHTIVENFYTSAEKMIEATIFEVTNGKDMVRYHLSKAEKLSVVRTLNRKGFFDFKEAVTKVAEAFHMSEVSIYKYIQEVKQKN